MNHTSRWLLLLAPVLLVAGCDNSSNNSNTSLPVSFPNPIFRYDAVDPTFGDTGATNAPLYTADGAVMVWNDTVYWYTGHDEAPPNSPGFVMNDWRLFESKDLVHWTNMGPVAAVKDETGTAANGHVSYDLKALFSWATQDAWAQQVVERDDASGKPKFYLYAPVNTGTAAAPSFSIGVAVADSPQGPFRDARGIPLILASDTPQDGTYPYGDIDPTTFVDDNGRAYMVWGNTIAKAVELETDMIHLKGEQPVTDPATGLMTGTDKSNVTISILDVPYFEEAAWLGKHGGLYYLSYATSPLPEQIAYATSTSPLGPWTYGGVLLDNQPNTITVHQSIFDFKGASFMTYHTAALPGASSFRRASCLDRLYYNADGSVQKVVPTFDPATRPGKRIRPLSDVFAWLEYPLAGPAATSLDPNTSIGAFGGGFASASLAFGDFANTEWKVDAGLAAPEDTTLVSFLSVAAPTDYLYDSGVYNGADALAADHALRVGPPPSDPTALVAFKKAATFKYQLVPPDSYASFIGYASYLDNEASSASPLLYLQSLDGVPVVQEAPTDMRLATFDLQD